MSKRRFYIVEPEPEDLHRLKHLVSPFLHIADKPLPPKGWIHAVRSGLNISLQQLATRMGITRQSAQEIEKRERIGSLTINTLRQAAGALDMQLVYGFAPRGGSIHNLIKKRSDALARKLVLQLGQPLSEEQLQHAINATSEQLQRELPRILWD